VFVVENNPFIKLCAIPFPKPNPNPEISESCNVFVNCGCSGVCFEGVGICFGGGGLRFENDDFFIVV
jgi:hypothetical protein